MQAGCECVYVHTGGGSSFLLVQSVLWIRWIIYHMWIIYSLSSMAAGPGSTSNDVSSFSTGYSVVALYIYTHTFKISGTVPV